MNPCTQITIRFSAKLRIESGNYETPVFIYSKIEKKKFNTNLLPFLYSNHEKTKCEITF